MLQKIFLTLVSTLTLIASALAHSEQDQNYSHMMWNDGGSWMHNAGHMTGYNMWGMGWPGLLFGLTFWILVILGIIYLYQQITEE